MKIKRPYCLILLSVVTLNQTAYAVDSNETSRADAHPSCMDRATDASSGDCIIQNGSATRHYYPPPGPASMEGNTLGSGGTMSKTDSPEKTLVSPALDHNVHGLTTNK